MLKKFSVILPVKNGGELLKICIQSILSQTNQNFDLLILENCSTDGTKEWIQSLNDAKIKIFPSDKPLTIEENWSRIKDIPKNEFITLIGHDDLLHADYLEEMNNLIEKYPEASLYQTHFRFINAEGNFVKSCRKMHEKYRQSTYLDAILEDKLDSTGTGYMMRSIDYNNLAGIPAYPNLLFADHALWIQLTGLSYMTVSEKECFSYRLNQSTSKLSGGSKYIDAFYAFLGFIADLQKKDEKIAGVIKYAIPDYIHFYCRSLSHRLLKTPINRREGKTVAAFIDHCKKITDELSPGNNFKPLMHFNIRLAWLIDSNIISQKLYLLFRKFYSKPIYS